MALTQKQKAILNYLKGGEKKKSQIVNKFKSWYYANSSKHIGDVLSRMVNSNIIVRVKKGVYRLRTVEDKKRQVDLQDENQISIF